MSNKLLRAHATISGHLEDIRTSVFKEGSNMNMAFIAYDPTTPGSEVLVTDVSDLNEIRAALGRLEDPSTIIVHDQPVSNDTTA